MKYIIATASIALLFPLAVHNKYCDEGTTLRFATMTNSQSNINVAREAQTQHCEVLNTARSLYSTSRFN